MKRAMRLNIKNMILVIGVCAALSAVAEEYTLLDNTGFERGEASWDAWGDGDLKQEYYGLNANEGDTFLRLWTRSGWYQDFPTHKNNKYLLSAYVATARNDGLWGDAFAEVKIEWRNKGAGEDLEIGEGTFVTFNLTGEGEASTAIPADEWSKITLPTVSAPEGATHCRVLCTVYTDGGDVGGGCALFDNITISQVGTPWTR